MQRFVIFVTNIVYRDENDEFGSYSFQTAMTYNDDLHELDEVRVTVGRHNVGLFLNKIEPDRSVEDIVVVSTNAVGKDVLGAYINHLALVN